LLNTCHALRRPVIGAVKLLLLLLLLPRRRRRLLADAEVGRDAQQSIIIA